MNKLFAEAIGTFTLVFAGTGAIIVDAATGGGVSHVGVAITFGLVVMAMIYAVGDVSGAHLNPAVTVGFVLARRFELRRAPGYIVAQFAGAFAASGVLRVIFPASPTLGETLPSGAAWQSFTLETILTFLLMFVILRVSAGSKEKGITVAIAVGGVVALEAMFAGPICGASMNPARSLAPAIVAGHTHVLWVYLIAPLLGAAIGVACEKGLGVGGE
jgi:aquaporin Z